MKVNLAGVIRDVQLATLAFAIALGWSLYQMALGVGTLIEGVTYRVHSADQFGFTGYIPGYGGGLTWVWGHHPFSFGQFVLGLIELGTVLLVAVLVRRFSSPAAPAATAAPPAE
jgi:hypothetical protein